MRKITTKKQKKIIRLFVCELLSNMNLLDKIKFVFTGNYYSALSKTQKKYDIGNFVISEKTEPTKTGKLPEEKESK